MLERMPGPEQAESGRRHRHVPQHNSLNKRCRFQNSTPNPLSHWHVDVAQAALLSVNLIAGAVPLMGGQQGVIKVRLFVSLGKLCGEQAGRPLTLSLWQQSSLCPRCMSARTEQIAWTIE
jgi:hypothetical protein